MFDQHEKDRIEAEESERIPIGVKLTKAGKHLRVVEFCGGRPALGKINNAKGRAAAKDTTPEQKAKNAKKNRRKMRNDFMDAVNANEDIWTAFTSLTCADVVTDPDDMQERIKNFIKRVNYHAKKRYGAEFVTNYVGIVSFQDGKRRKDKQGRYSLHAHLLENLPYWETRVIVAEDAKTEKGKSRNQRYLQKDGSWSKLANADSVFFVGWDTPEEQEEARKKAMKFIRLQKNTLLESAGAGRSLRVKKLPLFTVLWGWGHVKREWFSSLSKRTRKQGKEDGSRADCGAYMAGHYMDSDRDLEKLDEDVKEKFTSKKSWFHSFFECTRKGEVRRPGGLKRAENFYNEDARQELIDAGAWDCLTSVKSFYIASEKKEDDDNNAFEVGNVVLYKMNLHAFDYPAIKTISLTSREYLDLSEDVFYMTLEIDKEIERRELEAVRGVFKESPNMPQEEQWWQADMYNEPSQAYQQQCVF